MVHELRQKPIEVGSGTPLHFGAVPSMGGSSSRRVGPPMQQPDERKEHTIGTFHEQSAFYEVDAVRDVVRESYTRILE